MWDTLREMRHLYLSLLMACGMAFAAEVAPQAVDLMAMNQDARCRQVLVSCMVGGQHMRMMLDTGATHTVLHAASAAGVKDARWIDTGHITFMGNAAQTPKMMVAPLLAGPAESPMHPIMVMDLAAVRTMMAENVDGILGMDILGSVPFTFDMQKGELYWGIPSGKKLVPLHGTKDSFGRHVIQAKCGGKTIPLLLDTGSSITRVRTEDWAPGVGAEIQAHVGDVNAASRRSVVEGKAGDVEVAPGVQLRGVLPILTGDDAPPVLGMDALKDVVLVHVPMPDSPHGIFLVAQ